MRRLGECIHCGNCCAGCKLLVWRSIRDIKIGEKIESGKDFVSECLDYGGKHYLDTGCDRFPSQLASVPSGCSYYFIEDEE